MSVIGRYTHWLHTRWPAGTVEKLPEIREDGTTAVPGVRIVGDLTGVPLLKFSSDSGAKAVKAILAEPGAVIGFAGPRVIKQTLGQDLPEGFQTAEFLRDHGMVDSVVHRRDLKTTVGRLLRHMSGKPAVAGWASA